MSKIIHEIRDPIHTFIRITTEERKVLDSRPFQRLRHIHQLAMTYLVYPGATHKRFEHSLGVMELATRVFDVVTQQENMCDEVRNLLPQISDQNQKMYWREVLRVAALCHDMGHLPFSHAAEKDLLPEGWSHERLTADIIQSEEMENIWNEMTPPLRSKDIVKVAVGEKEIKKFEKETELTPWERILSEIITGNVFGVDRIDYLLRDSLHSGVAYGKFDHYRLIDTLRILPSPEISIDEKSETYPKEPSLGIEEGGLHSAEALLLARYFMFTQVYLHPVRRIYDIHLKEFLINYLEGGKFSTNIKDILDVTDNNIIVGIVKASEDEQSIGYRHAKRIAERKHFKVLYQRNPEDYSIQPDASRAIYEAACRKFGKEYLRHDTYEKRDSNQSNFLVKNPDGRITWAGSQSTVINTIPPTIADFVFIDPIYIEEARKWLQEHRRDILSTHKVQEEEI